jgi:5-methylcytosine-specific restriction endonuclease McrA
MQKQSIFFRVLQRRAAYDKNKQTNEYFSYQHYRTAIAEDCNFRCVYCDSHENEVGGREAMELDHFRPWNKGFGKTKERKFQHLKHEPGNLVHACGVCNGFKWSHWPTEDPDRCYDHEKGWIDPFQESRADFLDVSTDGTVTSIKPPGAYQIAKLRLNRPLLKRQREFRLLMNELTKFEDDLREVIANENGSAHAKTAAKALEMFDSLRKLLPTIN